MASQQIHNRIYSVNFPPHHKSISTTTRRNTLNTSKKEKKKETLWLFPVQLCKAALTQSILYKVLQK